MTQKGIVSPQRDVDLEVPHVAATLLLLAGFKLRLNVRKSGTRLEFTSREIKKSILVIQTPPRHLSAGVTLAQSSFTPFEAVWLK